MKTVRECAEILGCSVDAIRQHIHRRSRLGRHFEKDGWNWVIAERHLSKYIQTMRRPHEIRVNLSEAERRTLHAEAKRQGRSCSDLLRWAFFGSRKLDT